MMIRRGESCVASRMEITAKDRFFDVKRDP